MCSRASGGRARRVAIAAGLLTLGAIALPASSTHPLADERAVVAPGSKTVGVPGFSRANTGPTSAPDTARIKEAYGKLALSFEENRGQTDGRVKFLSCGKGYALFLTDSGATLSLKAPATAATSDSRDSRGASTTAVQMTLVSARKHPRISGVDALPGRVNYFIDTLPGHVNYFRGNDRAKWRTDIPTYARVRYEQVYPGIDLVYYGTSKDSSNTTSRSRPGWIPTPSSLRSTALTTLRSTKPVIWC